ncbi:MAG: SGNH/GDSL hydrolase family protein [Leptospira sp.]|nr:SGNH/GDSL hydrolase family protein [Leptospira sp.]
MMKKQSLKILFLCCLGNLFLNCYHSKKEDIAILILLSRQSSPIRITVVGDSLSQWSDTFGLKNKLPASYQITDVSKAGYDTTQWLTELSVVESIPTDIWIVELGTNDASYYGTNGFLERYTQLIERLSNRPFSIFLLSTVPITNQVGLHQSIQKNNESIRALVQSNQKYRLADLEQAFSNTGNATGLYSIADPIHPNQIGYEIIGETYRKILLGF